jgi:hypothetical protein
VLFTDLTAQSAGLVHVIVPAPALVNPVVASVTVNVLHAEPSQYSNTNVDTSVFAVPTVTLIFSNVLLYPIYNASPTSPAACPGIATSLAVTLVKSVKSLV